MGEALAVKGSDGVTAKDEVGAYLMASFGSPQRLDYGTGHELSFVAFVGCLWKLGFFKDGQEGGAIEREIVLNVIEPYVSSVSPSRSHLKSFLYTAKLRNIRQLTFNPQLSSRHSHPHPHIHP